MSLIREAREAAVLKRRTDQFKALQEDAKTKRDKLSESLFQMMDDEGIPSVALDMSAIPDEQKEVALSLSVAQLDFICESLSDFATVPDDMQPGIAQMASDIIDYMKDCRSEELREFSGVRNVGRKQQFWVFPKTQLDNPDREKNIEVIRSVFPELVVENVNARSLTASVKEGSPDPDKPSVPDALKGAVETETRYSLSVTKGK